MGDDIETGRSKVSDYWAELRCWLSKNQNKLNPNRCHYPFLPILVLTYNFRFPRYNFVSLAGNNASPSCMLKLWWTSCHKWWHHHRVDEPFCFAPSHRVESCNMETKIIQLNHFSMGHPVSYENLRKKYLMKKKGCG